ncbi:MAG: FeoB-associated Cys-rich membrane protein [Gemmatimonadaceae bacterium]|nr:FeoB-associated Cys-rich membrane protein [Gemmatimonadaceae bacterium]
MQTLIVLAVVALAALAVARRIWKAVQAARKPAGGCGSDCGCDH